MSAFAGVWNIDGRPVDMRVMTRLRSVFTDCSREMRCDGALAIVAEPGTIASRSQSDREAPGRRDVSVVFDGRLDNRDDLVSRIDRRDLIESADNALVLAAFTRWGNESLSRLNGEFTAAMFDGHRQELTLARDPVGCRPLYYWTNGRTLVFGSTIKALLSHPDVPSEPNHDLIADYFVRGRLPYEDYGETFFQDIHAVLPGHLLTVSQSRVTSHRFWDFDLHAELRFENYSDYADRLRELLVQAVERRLRRMQRVAIAVSGGLDSSIVLCVADQLRRQHATGPSLHPVCLTTPSIHSSDEQALQLLESTTQLRIARIPLGPAATARDVQDAAWHGESPRFDDGWLAQRPMFAWAHTEGAETMLTGNWSDQLSFATGYLSDLFKRLEWRTIARHLNEYTRWFVDADRSYFRRRFGHELAFNLTSHELRRWLRPLLGNTATTIGNRTCSEHLINRLNRSRRVIRRPRTRSAHTRDIYQAVRAKARRLQFESDYKAASSCGMEWTTPFLDRDLIAFLMAVPGAIQNRGGVPRSLLRDSMRGIVPDSILRRTWRNDDNVLANRHVAYQSSLPRLEAAHALGFVREPFRIERETLDFAGLEFWSRGFFSDRLTSLQPPRQEVCVAMDTTDPSLKDEDEREKLPYSPPKLTVHGDLRTITAAKQSDRTETGQPKTFSSGMP